MSLAIHQVQKIKGYELLESIGAGGFGVVYRAYQSTIGREVAVKVIQPLYATHPEFILRFEREAQLISRLEHLHIVPIYDYWRDPESAYIMMRWLRGGSLTGALQQRGTLDLDSASLLLDHLAAGLFTAHKQNIVHGNLKPSNILLDEEGNAYLSDFGITSNLRLAVDIERDNYWEVQPDSERENHVHGSTHYLAPEHLRGQEPSPQSDIYSLGIVLWEAIAGQLPFPAQSLDQGQYEHIDELLIAIDTPDAEVVEAVIKVIKRATSKLSEHRFQDALEMAAAFREAAVHSKNDLATKLEESLTLREHEILNLISKGNTNKQIAEQLFLEMSTIKWYINKIYKKLGVRTRVQAILRARELDLIVSTKETEREVGDSTHTSIDYAPVNPYKGLRAFESADNRDYFGREVVVDYLLSKLAVRSSRSGNQATGNGRFLAIVGPSGSGKSSLVKAGLVPAIWSGIFPKSDKWFVLTMVPGARPLDALETSLTHIAVEQGVNIREHLDRDGHGLARVANHILPDDDSELLVIIDQFEELFTVVDSESTRSHLLALIQGAVTDPDSRVRVVITLRADYYDRPLHYPDIGPLVRAHQETLLPLSAEELERAIVNPAQQAGVTFEQGLVATIIEDATNQPGALPLMQFALTELFEQRSGTIFTRSAYQAIGGAAGALAKRAEELYQEQDKTGKEIIRQMFLRLVTIRETKSNQSFDGIVPVETRRRVSRAELLSATSQPDRLDDIIDTYTDYRLLTVDHDHQTRHPTVELAHEALFRAWKRLRGWLEKNKADLNQHQQLIRATGEWDEAGRDESFLLRGSRLAELESWAEESQMILTQNEHAYLDASISKREERAYIDRSRQEQEAFLKQRANQRLKLLVAVLALGLIVSIGLTITTIFFANRAEDQERISEEQQRLTIAHELAAAAEANLEKNPERSILLTLEAIETTYNVDGSVLPGLENLLHKAVQADRTEITIPMTGFVRFRPDGKLLAIGGSDGELKIWDSDTGRMIRALNGHTSLISDLSFSPEGRFLASASWDGSTRIWDVTSGIEIASIMDLDGEVNSVSFSSDGRQLVTGDQNGVRIWDVASLYIPNLEDSGTINIIEPEFIQTTPSEANIVIYSPDGKRVAAMIFGLGILVWDVNSGEQELEIQVVSDYSSGIAFSPNGEFLAASAVDGGVNLWDSATGEKVTRLPETVPITGLDFSLSGRLLAAAAKDGMISLWDIESSEKKIIILGQPTGYNFMDLSPDGYRVAAGNGPERTSIWDVSPIEGRESLTIAAHNGKVHDAIYNSAGTRIASSGKDGRVKIWDAVTGKLVHDLPAQEERVHFPAFNPDGDRLAAANRDGGITIWDAATGGELLALYGVSPVFTAIAFSPDGTRLAAGGKGGIVHIWDSVTGKLLTTIPNPDGTPIIELVYSPDGDSVYSYDLSGISNAWDVDSGEHLISSSPGLVCEGTLWDAELSSDGRFHAMASFDGFAYVYQAVSQPGTAPRYEMLYDLAGHEGVVTGVALNPEGTILASSGFDGTARLWDLDTGEMSVQLTDQLLPLEGIEFSPNGRQVVTAGGDGTVRVYVVNLEELMNMARAKLSRDFTQEECQRYSQLLSCGED
jgi:WD40 repeat protein/serine/threonine protein kinase